MSHSVARSGLTAALILVAQAVAAQSTLSVLKEFDSPMIGIQGGILRTPDGMLYGTSYGGGQNGLGGIFRVQSDGNGFTVLRSFQSPDGYAPYAALTQDADGLLYGTAQSGGSFGVGTIFRLQTDGTGFAVLHSFDTLGGSYPYGGLVQGADGAFYGVATQGGASGKGTVFKVLPDGSGFTTLHAFTDLDGSSPRATLALLAGRLFGTTYQGGTFGLGTIFALNTDGTGFATLHSFTTPQGTNPSSPLIQAVDGALYGTAFQGGASGYGTIFKIQPGGSGFTVLASLGAAVGNAAGGVIQGLDGALYGPGHVCCSGGTVFRVQTNGSGFTTLHNFVPLEGSGVITPLVQGADGTLYGVTQAGGTSNSGAVFTLAPDGTGFATLHSLRDESGEGSGHQGPVTLGGNGRLLGVTVRGGSAGAGTVFGLDEDGGNFAVLHSLDPGQGRTSWGGLVRGLDGSYYGTTQLGGAFSAGTVFRVEEDGSAHTVLHAFNGSDGNQPLAGLTQGPDGTLYGTSAFGGVFKLQPDGTGFVPLGGEGFYEDSGVALGPDGLLYGAASQGGANGAGVIFKMATDGTGLTVLRAFSGSDGASPNGVTLALDGTLYGSTRYGGDFYEGTLFKMSADGSGFTTLRHVAGLDGSSPVGTLLEAADGRLFGTTMAGGANGRGTAFVMQPDGTSFEVLHAFGGLDGATPWASLVANSEGDLFGTTYQGGPRGGGVVYKLTPPPAPAFWLSVQDAAGAEGGTATFKVTLNTAAPGVVTVTYATTDVSARAGVDYRAVSNTLTFAPGQTSKLVAVRLLDDLLNEDDETFHLALSNPTGAAIGQGQALGTIRDDDLQPSLAVTDVITPEGDSGQRAVRFAVALSRPSGRTVSVQFETRDATATSPDDYTAITGLVTIPAGERRATFEVLVTGDGEREPNELFSVILSLPEGATLRRRMGYCRVLNDDK